MVKPTLAGAIAAITLLSAGSAADADRSGASSCQRPAVRAVINRSLVCLRTGTPCKLRDERQYSRYGFLCDSGVLARRRKTSPPITTAPTTTTTTPLPTDDAAPPNPFSGSWWSLDSSDGSLQQVTFEDDGTISYEDDSAYVCGGVAGYATAHGAASGNMWTASAPTTLLCPDNDGSVPNVLFQFTLNPDGILSGSVGPDPWTRTLP